MKKIMLSIVWAIAACSLNASGQTVRQMSEQVSSQCPVKIYPEWTLASVEYTPQTTILTIHVSGETAAYLPMAALDQDAMKAQWIENLSRFAQWQPFIDMSVAENRNVDIVVCDCDDAASSVTASLTPADFAK